MRKTTRTESSIVALFLFVAIVSPGLAADGEAKWAFFTDASRVTSAAIGADGTVYVGSANIGGSAPTYLYAVNPDGTEKWAHPTSDLRSAPVVGPGGTIYVVTADDELIAVDPGGNRTWTFAAADLHDASPAVGFDGTIYLRSFSGVLYAVLPDGSEKWNLPFDANLTTSPVIGSDGTIYVGSADSNLYAINADGTEKWGYPTGGNDLSSPAIGADGTVYFGSNDHTLYAVNSDGSLAWDFDDESSGTIPRSPVIGCDGMIYVGYDAGFFHALTSEGTWEWMDWTPRYWASPAIGADCTIYAGTEEHGLVALTQAGAEKWKYDFVGDGHTFPVIGEDGTVYIGSNEGALYAIETESAGVGCSAWPMVHRDARGSGLGGNFTARTLGGVLHEWASSIVQSKDCGHVVAGTTTSFGAGNADIWVVKLDAVGRVDWEQRYGGDGIDGAASLQATSDGGYILGGSTDQAGAGGVDIWALKLDRLGDVTWQKTYGGGQDDRLGAIRETADGFVIAGRTESFGADVRGDAWVLKLDADGNVAQQRTYGTWEGSESVWDIRPTLGGGFVAAGPTTSFGVGNGDAWVIKLNADLTIAWEKAYGGPEIDSASVVRPVFGGGYYVAGRTWVESPSSWDVWLLRLDGFGEVVWQLSYSASANDAVADMEVTPDSGVVMVGSSGSLGVPEHIDGWIAKIDASGAIQWWKSYVGADYDDYEAFSSVHQTVSGDLVVAGSTDSIGIGSSEMLMLRTNSAGDESAECAVLASQASGPRPIAFETTVTAATVAEPGLAVASTTVTPQDSSGFVFDVCNPWAVTIGLPKTGQVTSHEAGDDGHIQAGVAWPVPRFTDNGDGTLLDNLTGLVWLKDGDCFDSMIWEATFVTARDFNDHPENYPCADYVPAPDAGPWRVPNLNELESLVNAEATNQAAWLNGQGFTNVRPDLYWTSATARPENGIYAWMVDLDAGYWTRNFYFYPHYLWLVRGGQRHYHDFSFPTNVWKTGTVFSDEPDDDGDLRWGVAWPDPRFTDLGDGTVIDNLTGLMWLQDVSCLGQVDWWGAFAAVAAINTAGSGSPCVDNDYDDWTVPNRKQLLSLLDRAESRPVLTAGHPFVNMPPYSVWWSSTANAAQANPAGEQHAWNFDFWFGMIASYEPGYTFPYVWPVRVQEGFSPIVAGRAGEIDLGAGEELKFGKAGAGDVTLAWAGSCLASDTDFEIYHGTLGDFTSHVPLLCSTGGVTSVTLTPSTDSVYYLVVPSNASVEGSYGLDSDWNERPVSSAACKPRSIGECPP